MNGTASLRLRPESLPSSGAAPLTPARNAAIDHLRIVLTVLVILHHAAISYGGSGSWYWREEPNASSLALLMFNATNQSFFMGFFFLLAGYYTPPAYERKGAARFLRERLVRLGIPLLGFFFLLHPFTVALSRTSEGHSFWPGWWQMIREGVWDPGPLWFAQALLIFAFAYAGWRTVKRDGSGHRRDLPRPASLAAIALALGLISFLVRLEIPVGRNVLWLQLGYFPCYIFLFAAGCVASRARLLENVSFHHCRPWLAVAALALLSLPLVLKYRWGQGAFEGGWNLNALYYALWDPLVAWGAILGSLWWVGLRWSKPVALTSWLAANAYGAFIVHAPVLVAFSLLAATWTLPPLAKFALVGAAASAGSFALGSLLRALPGARRVL